MRSCILPYCTSRYGKDKVSFHGIPADMDRRNLWIEIIKKESALEDSSWYPNDYDMICSNHFKPEDFRQGLKRVTLKIDAVPSIFPDCSSCPALRNKKDKMSCPRVGKTEINRSLSLVLHTHTPLTIAGEPSSKDSNVKLPDKSEPLGNVENLLHNATFESALTILKLQKRNKALQQKYKLAALKLSRAQKSIKRIKSQNKLLSRQHFELVEQSGDLLSIKDEALAGSEHALFILDQIKAQQKKKIRFSNEVLNMCVMWQKRFPKGYKYVRDSKFLKLPGKTTIRKFLGHIAPKSVFAS